MLGFSALRWLHTFISGNNPLGNEMCSNIKESAKRSKSKPVIKKRPVLEDFIKVIVYKYASQDCSLKIRINKLFEFVMVNIKNCTE